ncbi:hypothetical protein NUW58_g5785 [Xylaria curta]|uniref:Uncharacterized protein n=1 Tax=Xylaria curta TaxID=42375 RepID=A0ACC1P143_9PEZI|nr:hypothetical protein NUW58_g5785 [Xylaria curta]
MPMLTAVSLPIARTAIVEGNDHRLRIEHNVSLPTLRADEMLVRVKAVAINPCDYKMHERFPCPGAVDGCDFSGVIVALGSDVENFSIGDRVCGAVHGSNPVRPESGAFADYIVSESEFTLKVPADMSFEEAAGLGATGLATLGMALFKALALPGTPEEPVAKPRTVLVHGGSSSVGTMAMQLNRGGSTGHIPIATCSPKNFALARSFGAEEVFDYNSPDCAKDIKTYTKNTLSYVLDPFTDAKSIALCYGAMGRAGGRYSCLEMHPDYILERKSIKVGFVMGPALLGHRLALSDGYERDEDPEMRAWGVQWYQSLQKVLDQGKLRPHPLRVLGKSFEAVLEGVEMLKRKAVSGEKLVVILDIPPRGQATIVVQQGHVTMLSSATIFLAIAAVLCPVFYSLVYTNGLAAKKRALAHIPELRFEKDDTPDRYRTETRHLLRIGYKKYLQYGVPFQMHNPVGELGNQVILPIKYLDEVKRAPKSLYSFEAFSEKLFLLNYFNSPRQTDAITHTIRLDINRNLDNVINGLWGEAGQLLKETVPATGWKTIPGSELATNIVSRTVSFILVGPTLCRNREWQQIAIEATFAIVEASLGLRAKYTPNWRWLARWQDGTGQRLGEIRKRAMELVKPLYDERRQALNQKDGQSFYDTIYWLLSKREADKSLKGVVDQQLFMTLASIHTTGGTLQSILFDWLDHPEYHAEITAEINEALAEVQSSGGKWTLQRVAAMKKLDSFMKESTRINPVGFLTGQRYALKSHTFKDGFVLPAGTIFHFPMDAVHHDPNIYPDPDKFDAYRFLRLREKIDPNQFHYAFVSDMTLNWGAGTHACPGRFLAALIVKFALILLITRYEIKFSDGRPQEPAKAIRNMETSMPSIGVELEFLLCVADHDQRISVPAIFENSKGAPVFAEPNQPRSSAFARELAYVRIRATIANAVAQHRGTRVVQAGEAISSDPDGIHLQNHQEWNVGRDGSLFFNRREWPGRNLNDYSWVGIEICSPALWATKESFDEIRAVVEALKNEFWILTPESAGMHWHYGNGKEYIPFHKLRRIAALLLAVDPLIAQLHPEHRRNNTYCLSNRLYSLVAHGRPAAAIAREIGAEYVEAAPEFPDVRDRPNPVPRRSRRRTNDLIVPFKRGELTGYEFDLDTFVTSDLLHGESNIRQDNDRRPLEIPFAVREILRSTNAPTVAHLMRYGPDFDDRPAYSFLSYTAPNYKRMITRNDGSNQQYQRKRTIEFRQMASTMEPDEVVAHGRVIVRLCEFAAQIGIEELWEVVMDCAIAEVHRDWFDVFDLLAELRLVAEAKVLQYPVARFRGERVSDRIPDDDDVEIEPPEEQVSLWRRWIGAVRFIY